MLKKLKFRFIITYLFLLISLPVMAVKSTDPSEDYFKATEQITKPPIGSTAILACDLDEKKRFLHLMKQSNIKDIEDIELADNGNIYVENEEAAVYKGDFSNEGAVEYALIVSNGVVYVYRLKGNQLVDANLDQVIIKNLLPGGDMSRFYMNTASPFAITKNGKTYLRFMSFPGGHADYDKTQLELCTYLWQGKQFTLAGPNWRYTSKNGNLVPALDCIGAQEK